MAQQAQLTKASSLSRIHDYTRLDTPQSGQVISPTQRPLRDNTQHS